MRRATCAPSTFLARWSEMELNLVTTSSPSTTTPRWIIPLNRPFESLAYKVRKAIDRIFLTRGDNELKTTGSHRSTVVSIGDWRPLPFLGYADITPEIDWDMSKLLLETDDLESNLDVGHWARGPPCDLESDIGRWGPAAYLGMALGILAYPPMVYLAMFPPNRSESYLSR